MTDSTEAKKPTPSKGGKPTTKKKNGNKSLPLILLLLLLASTGTFVTLYILENKERKETKAELEKTNSELEQTLADLEETKLQLEAAIAESKKYGLEIEDLEAAKLELDKQLKAAKSRAWLNKKELNEYKKSYGAMLQDQSEEILKYKATIKKQGEEITEYQHKIVAIQDTVAKKNEAIEELEEVKRIGQILKAERFNISAYNSKGNEVKLTKKGVKGSKIDMFKIKFTLLDNAIADVETKEVYLQIKEPSGIPVYDLNFGGGEFELNGETTFYTVMQEVMYVNEGVDVNIMYKKQPTYNFKVGKYIIDVFVDGELVGTGDVQIK